jgi:hypothetical protein
LRDVAGILKASGEKVNRAHVEHRAEEFGLKEIWDAIQKRLSAPTAEE